MKLTINVTKKTMEHFLPTHDFFDCCSPIEKIMKKVIKAYKLKKRIR